VGQLLDGRYRVEGRIAVGGMATVYRALDTRLDRVLALKVMHPGYAGDPEFVDRFIREAKSVARLDHPNVVGVHDQGSDGTYVFLAMEYVAGCTLRDVLRDRGALQPRAALDILEPVLAALGAAHMAGLVHRDVKPENVLIGDDGRVKVADFGLVRAVDANSSNTTAGSILGTVSYLSPEQIEDGTVDARSDVYACGVMLYEMLTGAKPHQGQTPMQVVFKHVNEDVPAPSAALPGLAPELDQLVAVAAARDPGARPAGAIELLALLQATRRALTPAQLDLESSATAGAAPARGDHTTRDLRRSAPAGEQLNRTSRLQLPPELTHRRAEPADYPLGPPDAKRPARLRTRRGLIGLASVLALVLCVGGAAWFISEGRYTTVPSVLSLSKSAALARLDKAGLEAHVSQAFSESIPVGRVISTDPANGKRIRGGGTVGVTLSKGPERIAVPKVAGLSAAKAEDALRRAGLTVGTRKSEFSTEVPRGRVIRTDPATGGKLEPRAAVSLVLSKGAPVDVPSLIGMDLDDARQALSDAGLTLRTAPDEVFSDEVDKDAVAAQSPDDGTRAAKGSTVTVTVSKGPQLFRVPKVDGMKSKDAKRTLEEAGFKVDITDTIPLFGNDRVWRESPGGGSRQPRNTTINLWIK
jgi:eukaryotic-like serine/threonine-protein kinase